MDYTTLTGTRETVGSIKYAINYDRIDPAGILVEAEAWIYAKLRVRLMTAVADIALTSGVSTAAFPTGYLDPLHLCIPGVISRIKLKDIEWFRSHLGWDESAVLPEGPPTYWADLGGAIQFNYKTDQAYTAKMTYFRTPDALSADNPTNWLTSKYPTLVRRVCLMFASEARKEYDTFDREEVRAQQVIAEIKVEDDMGKRGLELDFNWNEND